MRACDDGYPTCRAAEAGGDWCKGACAAVQQTPGRERADLIARAVKQRAKIQQIFDDAAHWNRRNVPWKGKPIDPDPDGQLKRIADGIDRMIARETPNVADERLADGVAQLSGNSGTLPAD